MVQRFYVRCTVERVVRVRGAQTLEVRDVVSDVLYDQLDVGWLRQWGNHRELPPDGVELTQDHIDLYENNGPPDDGERSAVSSEAGGSVSEESEGPLPDDAQENEEIPAVERFIAGNGEPPPALEFAQNLPRRQGWWRTANEQLPGEIVNTLIQPMCEHVVRCTNSKIRQQGL